MVLQRYSSPFSFLNKLVMIVLLLQQIMKTFFFLRIFERLSYIVTMLQVVISDLRVFLLFYSILIVIFAMIFAVLGIGNANIPGEFQDYSAEIDARDELD